MSKEKAGERCVSANVGYGSTGFVRSLEKASQQIDGITSHSVKQYRDNANNNVN